MITYRPSRRGAAFSRAAFVLLAVCVFESASGQTSTVPSEGIADRPSRQIVLTNARIVVEPGRVIEHGSIELRDARIVSVTSEPSRANSAKRPICMPAEA